MERNKNGFTLIELLAVIVILGIIMVIATTNVLKNINDSKEKAKYMAAKEIVEISEAYFATKVTIDSDSTKCVSVSDIYNAGYFESDVTNPKTGENIKSVDDLANQSVCFDKNSTKQTGYALNTTKMRQKVNMQKVTLNGVTVVMSAKEAKKFRKNNAA